MTLPEALFPPQTRSEFSSQPPQQIDLPPAEAKAAQSMSAKRLHEFAHGRTCARLALAKLGAGECTIPVGDDRAPIWPDGFVGSISHAGEYATAVVALKAECRALGVDLEPREPLDKKLLPMICRPEEIIQSARSEEELIFAKILFSAKECVYKCVWPTILRFIEFHEIEIQLNTEAKSFRAVPHSTRHPMDLVREVHGRYMTTDDLIISAAYVL